MPVNEDDLLRLEQKIDKILTLLNGNGTPGVFVRLDRLEEWRKQREKDITAAAQDWKSFIIPTSRDIFIVILAITAGIVGQHFFH